MDVSDTCAWPWDLIDRALSFDGIFSNHFNPAALGETGNAAPLVMLAAVRGDIELANRGMDIHIGNCFPAYVTMLGAGVEMKEIIAICDDPKEIDWWKGSLAAWGATKLIITAAM